MRFARTLFDPADPAIRYALSKTGSRHIMLVSQPRLADAELDQIAARCPWAMRAASLDDAMQNIRRAGELLWRSTGEISFDSIDFVGHGHSGSLTMGSAPQPDRTEIWLEPNVLAAFVDLRVYLRDTQSVVRLLGCNVAGPVSRANRRAGTDGELLCTALARMADHPLQASTAALNGCDFTKSGIAASVTLVRYDRDGRPASAR